MPIRLHQVLAAIAAASTPSECSTAELGRALWWQSRVPLRAAASAVGRLEDRRWIEPLRASEPHAGWMLTAAGRAELDRCQPRVAGAQGLPAGWLLGFTQRRASALGTRADEVAAIAQDSPASVPAARATLLALSGQANALTVVAQIALELQRDGEALDISQHVHATWAHVQGLVNTLGQRPAPHTPACAAARSAITH